MSDLWPWLQQLAAADPAGFGAVVGAVFGVGLLLSMWLITL